MYLTSRKGMTPNSHPLAIKIAATILSNRTAKNIRPTMRNSIDRKSVTKEHSRPDFLLVTLALAVGRHTMTNVDLVHSTHLMYHSCDTKMGALRIPRFRRGFQSTINTENTLENVGHARLISVRLRIELVSIGLLN